MKYLQQWPERLRGLWQNERQRMNLLIFTGAMGMLLLCASAWLPDSGQETVSASLESTTDAAYEQRLEQRLSALISELSGAGDTAVMVTLETGQTTRYAADSRTESDSGVSAVSSAQETEHIFSGTQPVVESVAPPQVRGVAVLCQGGGDPAVQRRVTELVCALTGVGANRVTVNPMA